MNAEQRADCLRELFAAGVDAVGGREATARALQSIDVGDRVRLLAFGKAADAMVQGALPALEQRLTEGLLVTKYGHVTSASHDHPRITCLESAHPVPDLASLRAGEAVLRFVKATSEGEHLLVLISGGGSALVESLNDGIGLDDLQRRTDALLASGAAIGEINQERRKLSRIKGGGLLDAIGGGRVTQLLISDVPGDQLSDIASGPLIATEASGELQIETHIIASNVIARRAVAGRAESMGLCVVDSDGSLHGDVNVVADRMFDALPKHASEVVIFGGEPTVVLPASPGRGGRNQHLAALMAKRMCVREHTAVLVCGTDGSDGPTDAAGGLVDSDEMNTQSVAELDRAIRCADTGPWLERAGALIRTGPTGTNVMDLAIGLCGAE